MKPEKPDDGLEAREAGGKTEARPEVYAISRSQSGWALSRRSLFSAAVAASAAVPKRAGAAACATGAFAHSDSTASVAISPDGRLLASGGGDAKVKLWSLPDGALLKTLTGHADTVGTVAISPDGRLLASASRMDKTVKLWSLPDGTPLKTLSAWAMTVAISPDGRLLATVDSDGIRLWSLPDGALLKILDSAWAASAAFSPDGRLLATGDEYDGLIKLWSLPGGALLKTLRGHASAIWSLAFTPDGQMLASGSYDHTAKLWSVSGGVLLKDLTGHAFPVRGIAIGPDGRLLATTSDDDTIKLWSLPDGALLKTLNPPIFVKSVAISPDGGLLVSCGSQINLWHLPDGKPIPICLMDPAVSASSVGFIRYTVAGVTYTVPSGSPMPAGAVCTCNLVQGSVSPGGGCGAVYWYPN